MPQTHTFIIRITSTTHNPIEFSPEIELNWHSNKIMQIHMWNETYSSYCFLWIDYRNDIFRMLYLLSAVSFVTWFRDDARPDLFLSHLNMEMSNWTFSFIQRVMHVPCKFLFQRQFHFSSRVCVCACVCFVSICHGCHVFYEKNTHGRWYLKVEFVNSSGSTEMGHSHRK